MSRLIIHFERWPSFRFLGVIALFGVILGFITPSYSDEELPQLGEHSSVNIDHEVNLGKGIYDQLLARGLIETNLLLNRYINDLGERLLSTLDSRVRDYHFFIVRDGSINAFALPGGYIGINAGLILSARTQHQLASVMAHEIAHVRLRHGVKLMEKSRSTSNTMLLTILAGLLAGGTELGAALVYGGTAGGQQAMINYTREFEYEADRMGINLLQSAGFDGRGMVEFFQILGKLSGNSDLGSIEYLRTHPVSDNRVSEAESRLLPNSVDSVGPDYFLLFQDYLMYILNDGVLPGSGQFRRALSKMKAGEEDTASKTLQKLYHGQSDNFWYGIAYAENLQMLDRKEKAEEVYRQLLEIYPDDYIISLQLLRLLKDSKRLDQALVIGRRLENRYSSNKAVFFELVDLYHLLDKSLMEMLAQADYHRLSGSPDLAIKLYSKVLDSPDIDLATESRIREKLAELRR
ncbi:MAG: M48 family metalloprotease [Gammaproteobacteria bacterium]|nr:M48 family metalloprotease [Gammaproteobacteria bacterium]